jgi:hypothetical protein
MSPLETRIASANSPGCRLAPFASEDECGETDHDNQVYAESDEQCDQHGLGVSSPFESQVRFCRAFSVGESPPPDLRAEHPG